jgi:hypothetical protein
MHGPLIDLYSQLAIGAVRRGRWEEFGWPVRQLSKRYHVAEIAALPCPGAYSSALESRPTYHQRVGKGAVVVCDPVTIRTRLV